MAFDITNSDQTGLSLYANLYKASDLSYLWNVSSESFAVFDLSEQENFAIDLEEDEERIGFYYYTFQKDLEAVQSDKYYLIEIRKKIGSNYDRENDEIVGSIPFFWNGSEETAPFANTLGIVNNTISAKEIWDYPKRDITNEVSPEDVWKYKDRTLSENPCADIPDLINDVQKDIGKMYEVLNSYAVYLENFNTLLKQIQEQTKSSNIVINAKNPSIGSNGTYGPSPNIKIN